MEQIIKSKRGRKPGCVKTGGRQKTVYPSEKTFIEECLFPAFCQAFHSDPGQWKDRYLSVELSKTDISKAYGPENLNMWCSIFKQDKIGGRNRFGIGYKTRWSLNIGQYALAKAIIESMGHTIKELPNPGFPPDAMVKRLAVIADKAAARAAKRAAKGAI